jgi:hypothetical protein
MQLSDLSGPGPIHVSTVRNIVREVFGIYINAQTTQDLNTTGWIGEVDISERDHSHFLSRTMNCHGYRGRSFCCINTKYVICCRSTLGKTLSRSVLFSEQKLRD